MSLPVQLKVLDDRFSSVNYESKYAAGIDLQAAIEAEITIMPGRTVLIPTGISVYVGDPNYAAVILPRSGLGHKKGLVLGNGTGLIDADYQGQLYISAFNRNDTCEVNEFGAILPNIGKEIVIEPGDRIAQLVFLPIMRAQFEVVDEFHEVSERGEGGFGSTGVSA